MKLGSQNTPQNIGNWKILQKIGEGSFGSIYSVIHNSEIVSEKSKTTGQFALKTESITNVKQMLELQYQIYKEFEGTKGFPKVLEFIEEERFSYLVMEKLEMTLDKYAAKIFGNQFIARDTLLQIMSQTLTIVQRLHQKGYLYRDMKPANFMLKNPYSEVYIIDFGLCKKYIANGKHIGMKTNKKLVGTPIFCSLYTHAGIEQSRRDDIESWILSCLYFSMVLPWQYIANKKQLTKQTQYEQIYKIKKQIRWDQFIKQLNLDRQPITRVPNCAIKLIQYSRKLQFQQKPNYQFLQKLIKDEYKDLTNQQIQDNEINWKSKIEKQFKIDQQPLNDSKKQTQIQNDQKTKKRINKINFKAPAKPKKSPSSGNLEQERQIRPRQNTK